MKRTPQEDRIAAIVEPVVTDRGFALVAVKLNGSGKAGRTLQIMAEDPASRTLGIEDCAALSREIGDILDVEEAIPGAYRLEVSSPGIDRPLIKLQDFADFAGHEAKIELDRPLEGTTQKRFRGILAGLEEEGIVLDTETGRMTVPHRHIDKAKLVLTEALLALGKKD